MIFCGLFGEAQEIFSTLISRYKDVGCSDFGLEKFAKVVVKEWLTCIENHIEIMSKRLLEDNIELGNALLDMYVLRDQAQLSLVS